MATSKPGSEPFPSATNRDAHRSVPPEARLLNAQGSPTLDDFLRRILIEQSRDGIVVLDQDGAVHEANPCFAAMLGYSQEEIRRLHVWDWDCRWTRAELLKRIEQVDEVGSIFETRHRRKGGAAAGDIDVEITMSGAVIAGRKYVFCVHRDITAPKKAEEALRLAQFVMERAPDSIILVGEEGEVVYANDAACATTGYSRDELLAMKVFEIDPDFPAEGYPAHKERLKRVGKMTFESRHRTKAGRLFPVEVTTNYLEYKGRFLGCAFDRDISERKQAEREREKLQAQLLQAQKMESIGILAGGVAHDFNNLLQAMGAQIELLLRQKPSDHPDSRRLKSIEKAVERAALLVRQLLLFSRRTEPRKQTVDLNREAQEAARILERTIPRMISIELNLDPSAWPVNADPVQIEQVLLNLGVNAADAMPEGGRLRIETGNALPDSSMGEPIAGAEAGPYVRMTVADTGCGMEPETLAHVFDPFFTTKEIGRGTGLGLASVYGIVKGHGGHIVCSSQRGRGTVFKIYWPALPEGKETISSAALSTVEVPSGCETILVADDDEDIRELTAEALRAHGYHVLAVASGEQALEALARKDRCIDMVVLDLGMPGMGGYRCLEEMLQMDPSVRVLVASGYSGEAREKDVLACGAAGFIGKPYPLAAFLAKVREILDGDAALSGV